MNVVDGAFYQFHIYRVTSRAGQPILRKENVEIAPIISREQAVNEVRNGKDVYTFRKSDAKNFASKLYVKAPEYDKPREPSHFQHFHPGGEHPKDHFAGDGRPRARSGPGHVFFGNRGENYAPKG